MLLLSLHFHAITPCFVDSMPWHTSSPPLSSYTLHYVSTNHGCTILPSFQISLLQRADPTMLGLLSELIISLSLSQEGMNRLLFVGMYRDDEITSDLLSFTTSFVNAEDIGKAHCTEISLSGLSVDDIVEMTMTEMRLPRRIVSELASSVHKKTSGHAIFVTQLLNSFIRDSVIEYSPSKFRFDWDIDRISFTNTSDCVASFIVSNLSSLPANALLCLRIISCFGMQVQISFLELLEDSSTSPVGGLESCLPDLIEKGILDRAG